MNEFNRPPGGSSRKARFQPWQKKLRKKERLYRLTVVKTFQTGWQSTSPHGAKQNFAERSNRMNDLRIMFIVRPDVEEADIDKLIDSFKKNVASGGGEILSKPDEEKMGRRRLAYTVRSSTMDSMFF